LKDWQNFDSQVLFAELGKAYQPVPYLKEPFKGVEWSRGIIDLAEAISEQRPQRITGVQAAHVVDILCAIRDSLREGRPVGISSEFITPTPMDWAR
jgi:hypothetical protein